MTEVEYTEQAIDHLDGLDPQVADRVLNKVEEATEWTEHRLEPLSGYLPSRRESRRLRRE